MRAAPILKVIVGLTFSQDAVGIGAGAIPEYPNPKFIKPKADVPSGSADEFNPIGIFPGKGPDLNHTPYPELKSCAPKKVNTKSPAWVKSHICHENSIGTGLAQDRGCSGGQDQSSTLSERNPQGAWKISGQLPLPWEKPPVFVVIFQHMFGGFFTTLVSLIWGKRSCL